MQIGAASNGPLMDTPYTPYNDLPEKLQLEMQRLQHYKDRVNKQALWVVDVALSEWRKAEKKVAVQAAAQSLEEQSAQDRATCAAAIRRRQEERTTKESRQRDTFIAKGIDHAGELDPAAREREDRKKIARRPPSAITGYTGVARARRQYRALCGKTYLGKYSTAEEAAYAYDRVAIESNIAAGYDKYRLNFSRARTKKPRALEASNPQDLLCSEELGEEI